MLEDSDASLSSPIDLTSRRGPRSEFVYRALLGELRTRRMKPGQRIREEDVAKWLGVSRTPVREAFQHLQARRLVEQAPDRGVIVVELKAQHVMELYAMREVLEGAAARFAAQHAHPAEIAMMRELLDDFRDAEGDAPRSARINNKLHRTIYGAAGNDYVHRALNNLGDALSLLQGTTFEMPERRKTAFQEHGAIVAAIESRDSQGAEAASRRHMREAQRTRLQMMAG